jgi:hypothetical protein
MVPCTLNLYLRVIGTLGLPRLLAVNSRHPERGDSARAGLSARRAQNTDVLSARRARNTDSEFIYLCSERSGFYVHTKIYGSFSSSQLFFKFAAMGKFTIIDEGKVLGFQIKETAEDRQKGKTVFSHIALPPGITREEVEIVRSGWPQSARHRQNTDERLDNIKTVILKEGMSPAALSRSLKLIVLPACADLKRILRLKTLRPAENQSADRKWLLQIEAFLNYQLMGIKRRLFRQPRKDLALIVATGDRKGRWVQDRIMSQEAVWVRTRTFLCSQQGRHPKHLDKLLDEGTILFLRAHIAESKEGMTSQKLANAIVNFWNVQNIGAGVNENAVRKTLDSSTARRYLKKHGFSWKDLSKGLYKDGHEREDVVDYRENKYLPFMSELKPKMVEFSIEPGAQGQPPLVHAHVPDTIRPEERPIVPTYQDESTYHSNEGQNKGWVTEDWYPLRPKGEGAGINVSDFVTPAGRLRAPQGIHPSLLPKYGLDEGLRIDASQAAAILECGKGTWWNAEYLVKQLEEVAIPIFNLAFPGCQALFVFDNATLHCSYKEDALRAKTVNLYPGGKQPLMRPGRDHRTGLEQAMVLPNGEAKGAKWILQERGLWNEGMLVQCKDPHNSTRNDPGCLAGCHRCARGLLAMEPDFRAQKCRVAEVIEKHGHLVTFLPKYHPELNPIEYVWGRSKIYARQHCSYSLPALRTMVPECLGQGVVTDELVWKFFGRVDRIMEAYRQGEQYGTQAFKERVYRSHRRVGDAALAILDEDG